MKRVIVLVISLVLLGAACSSTTSSDAVVTDTTDAPDDDAEPTNGDAADGDDDPTDGDDTADGDTADDTDEDGPSDDDGAGGTEPTDDGDSGSGSTGSTPNLDVDLLQTSDWCTAARSIETSFDELEAPDLSNPEIVQVAYTTAVAMVRQSIEIAPPEIVGDVVTTADGLDVLVTALADAEWNFLDLELGVLDSIDQEMEVATFNIDRYNFEVCGIDNGFDPADDPALRPEDDGPTDPLPSDGTLRDQTIDSLVQVGFTLEEANCLIDQVDVAQLADVFSDQQTLLALLTECGIPLERLAQLGG